MTKDRWKRKCITRGLCAILLGTLIYTGSDFYTHPHPKRTSSEARPISQTSFATEGNLSMTTQHRLPECLIIGVRKAGTRAILKFLSSHPLIQSAGKEVHFFDKLENYKRGLEWYRSRMPLSRPDQITLEKTPAYFHEPEVPLRVFHYDAGVKLILVLRDPVTRVISDYTQTFTLHKTKGQFYPRFENLVFNRQTGIIDITYKPLQLSLYNIHLSRWLNYFPLSSIHVVNGERLIKRPWKELKQVERFLRLPPYVTQEKFYFNSTRGFYCLKSRSNNSGCLSNSKGRKHPFVDPQVLSKLRMFFEPYIKEMFSLIKKDFTWYD